MTTYKSTKTRKGKIRRGIQIVLAALVLTSMGCASISINTKKDSITLHQSVKKEDNKEKVGKIIFNNINKEVPFLKPKRFW